MPNDLRRILCIDDEPDVLMVARMCLETVGGFAVEAVSGGKAGIKAALNQKPDLILVDVMMPGMDGPSTLKSMREEKSLADVPVVFMSARVRADEIAGYLAMGANGVIPKPFDPMSLSNEVMAFWRKFHDA